MSMLLDSPGYIWWIKHFSNFWERSELGKTEFKVSPSWGFSYEALLRDWAGIPSCLADQASVHWAWWISDMFLKSPISPCSLWSREEIWHRSISNNFLITFVFTAIFHSLHCLAVLLSPLLQPLQLFRCPVPWPYVIILADCGSSMFPSITCSSQFPSGHQQDRWRRFVLLATESHLQLQGLLGTLNT